MKRKTSGHLNPLIAITVLLAAAFMLLAAPAAAQGDPILALNPATSTPTVGSTFNVTIEVQAGTNSITGVGVSLTFDPTILSVSSLTPGTALDTVLVPETFNNIAGTIDFTGGKLSPFPTGTFTVMTIAFQAVGTGTSAINFVSPATMIATAALTELTGPFTGGSVTVQPAGPTTGSITIVKDATPNAAQDFAFTTTGTGLSGFSLDDDADAVLSNSQSFPSLTPGQYTVTETAASGWSLTGITCLGDTDTGSTTDLAARTATLDLDAGESITCTFANQDSQPPVITLVGANPLNLTVGSPFTDPGAQVTDNVDAARSITGTGTVNVNTPGTYVVTYSTSDAAGNAAVAVTRDVVVSAAPPPPCPPISTLPCAQVPVTFPIALTFNSSAGGLVDNAGVGTGFTMVDPPSARLPVDGTPAFPTVLGYQPNLLALNTTTGLLTITSTKGIMFRDPSIIENTNSQINALGVGFSVNTANSTIFETVLVNPNLNPANNTNNTQSQQAGLWFGLNENNYAKLVIVRSGNNAARVQLQVENYGASATGPQPVEINTADNVIADLSTQTVTLRMVINPLTNTITGFYKIGTGAFVQVTSGANTTLPLPAAFVTGSNHDASGATPAISYAGIFATHRNADATPPMTIAFDSFNASILDTTPPVITLIGNNPLVLNVGDSFTDPGANVTDNSDAPRTITGTGTVNTAVPGSYIVTYNTTDAAGNAATAVNRTVNVIAPIGSITVVKAASPEGAQPFQFTGDLGAFTLVDTPTPINGTPIKINFQNAAGNVPSGYLRDFGQPYGPRTDANQGTGLTYGWVIPGTSTPLNLSIGGTGPGNGRDRNVPALDQRLDTLMHMQADDIPNFNGTFAEGAWEIVLPNGAYTVTVGVGDPNVDTAGTVPIHRINVEGVNAINNFVPTGAANSLTRFTTGTVTVSVTDGRLTLDATGGFNTKINYVDITPVSTNTLIFANRPVGTYTVTEALPSGWRLTDIVCTGDGGSLSTINVASRSVSIALNNGENIVCTFSNSEGVLPVAVNDGFTVTDGVQATLDVLTNDTFTGTPTINIVTPPSNGTAVVNGTSILYTGNADYNGSDSLTYTITDTAGTSSATTVSLTVNDCSTACYVSPTGSDTNDGLTWATPKLTIQAAINDVASGGQVFVAAGTYLEQLTIAKDVKLTGVDEATTILQRPASPTVVGGLITLVRISGAGVDVDMEKFTISGGAPYNLGACAPDYFGFYVFGGASLKLNDSTVTGIRLTDDLFGCQTGIALFIGEDSPGTSAGSALLTSVTVDNYQKGGIVARNTGTLLNVTAGSSIQGIGATTATAQNGIQISSGASGSVLNSNVSNHRCDEATCGPDGLTQVAAAGILIAEGGQPIQISGTTIANNDMGVYSWGVNTLISSSTLTNNRYFGVLAEEGTTVVQDSTITGSNDGIAVIVYSVATANSVFTATGNTLNANGNGVTVIDESTSFEPSVTVNQNAITANTVRGFNNTTLVSANAECNWWGQATGPASGGPNSVTNGVDFTPWLTTSSLTTPACDKVAPVITLVGGNPLAIEVGSTFTDPGATAVDNVDGDITANIVVSGTVNPNTVGSYQLAYDVTDSAGNAAATVTRTVNVTAPTTGALQGTVQLQGRRAPSPVVSVSLTVELYAVGGTTPVATFTPSTNNSGVFTTPSTIQPGTYVVWVKYQRHLAVRMMNVVITAGQTTNVTFPVMAGGDANNNNEINLLDLAILGLSYNTSQGNPAYDQRADINGDNTTDLLDLALIGFNYNTAGAPRSGQ